MKPSQIEKDRAHLHCLVPPQLHRRLRHVALDEGTTMGDLVTAILGPEIDRRFGRPDRAAARPE